MLNNAFVSEHREREREKARVEMERRMLLQHTTSGALDRLGKSLFWIFLSLGRV